MSKQEPGSPERIAEAVTTLSWLSDQVEMAANGTDGPQAHMVDALSLARSYVVEFAIHRSLGVNDSEAIAATARRELRTELLEEDLRRSLFN